MPTDRSAPVCGLYVHIPFCETKCGYCDFYSVALKDRETGPLVERVIRELRERIPRSGHRVVTVFCGGGTPTLLPLDELRALLDAIRGAVGPDPLEEFTVEANPATVDDEKARWLVNSGVTRVSMGAQSFFPEELAALERLHNPDDIAASVATLRRAGVVNLNLDLIFGIPGQTLETWGRSLQRAIDLGPQHIACYGLTYEPRTRLTALKVAGRVVPCDEELEAEMFELTVDQLTSAGYQPYETSNYAQPGFECRHNLIYWRNGPYIGVGPSAAGCYDGRRYKNIADVAGYVRMMDTQHHAEAESEFIDDTMRKMEMVMMQLRLAEGLSMEDFTRRTGADPRQLFRAELTRFSNLGVVAVSPTHISLTRHGRLVADAVIADLAAACGDRTVKLNVVNG